MDPDELRRQAADHHAAADDSQAKAREVEAERLAMNVDDPSLTEHAALGGVIMQHEHTAEGHRRQAQELEAQADAREAEIEREAAEREAEAHATADAAERERTDQEQAAKWARAAGDDDTAAMADEAALEARTKAQQARDDERNAHSGL